MKCISPNLLQRRRLRVFAALLLLVMLVAEFSRPIYADNKQRLEPTAISPEEALKQPGWVKSEKPPKYKLKNARTYVAQGTPSISGAYDFRGTLQLPDDLQPVEQRFLAVNPNTGQVIVEVGTPPLDVVEDASLPKPGKRMLSGEQTSSSNNLNEAFALTGETSARARVWWDDPANLDVNGVSLTTRFTWGGGRIHNCVMGYQLDWASWSGWDSTLRNWQPDCQAHEMDNYMLAEFYNPRFPGCAFIDTRTRYAVHLRGLPDGRPVLDWYTRAWGGCYSWLDYHHYLH